MKRIAVLVGLIALIVAMPASALGHSDGASKLCAKTIRERDGNRCQYTGEMLKPEEGSLDHVVPRSRGGKEAWENLVWSSKAVNTKKGNRLPHEAGLKLLTVPRAPKESPVSALIRNAHRIPEWRLFLHEKAEP